MDSPGTSRYVQRPDRCRPLLAWVGLGGNKVSQKPRRCEVWWWSVVAVVVMGGDSLGWTLDRADTLDTSALQITHPLIDSAGSQCRLDTLATGHRHSAPCSIVNRLPVTIFAAPASFPTKSWARLYVLCCWLMKSKIESGNYSYGLIYSDKCLVLTVLSISISIGN